MKQLINGRWRYGSGEESICVVDPASEDVLYKTRCATASDLDLATASAQSGFTCWAATSAWDRQQILLRIGNLLRQRVDKIAPKITSEQGKTIQESSLEVQRAADFFTWGATAAVRIEDRIVPSRSSREEHRVVKRPIGPVAAFTPWNYPIVLPAKKLSAALAAGCSVILKPSEETPSAAVELVKCCLDAGLPENVLNLVWGDPADISSHLLNQSQIQKVSFTGSVPVGKSLARQAAATMTPITLELGGHAPVIVCSDVDIESVVKLCVTAKFNNTGQACISPSRFFICRTIYHDFVDEFARQASLLRVGPGNDPLTDMGPLANPRRLEAIGRLVADAAERGGNIVIGGKANERPGYFYPATVISNVPLSAEIMSTEPFGPTATFKPYAQLSHAIEWANSLPVGLAAYAFTTNPDSQRQLTEQLEAGMIGMNMLPGHLPEDPFGGWKESGLGLEGGIEAVDGYLKTKLLCSHFNNQDAQG